ncbi:MAG: T9SS type A sorting domain-containing protein, partial [Flavobacteriaceae bacterium]
SIDPVSQKEIDRNNAIYNHQGNRNPFIDDPSYVTAIWNPQQDNENPSAPTNLVASNPTATSVDLNWNAATDNIAVSSYDIYVNSNYNSSTSATSATVTALSPETNYCFTVIAKDAANNSSTASNEDCATTLSGSTNTVDLFFSEYMEGSGTNKALEIANFTGATVNLSEYSIKLSSNGNSAWTNTYNFPSNASIPNEEVYVVANGGTSVCTNVLDNLNNAITGFNGNDALGLFKNDVLIDILGTLGDATVYAENITLVRNATITSGSTVYNANEWTSYPQNTCTNLGSHTQTLGVINVEPQHIKIYPNPVKGALLFIDVQQSTTVECYNLTGQRILKTTVSPQNNAIDISQLNSGVYLLQLQNKQGTTTRKIVRL